MGRSSELNLTVQPESGWPQKKESKKIHSQEKCCDSLMRFTEPYPA